MLLNTNYTSFIIRIIVKYISKIIKTYYDIFEFQCSNEIICYHLNLLTPWNFQSINKNRIYFNSIFPNSYQNLFTQRKNNENKEIFKFQNIIINDKCY